MLTKINLEYFGLYLNLLFEKDVGEPITINDTLNFNYSNYEKIYGKNNVSDTSKLNVKKSFCAFISGSASYNFNWGKIIIGDFNAEFGQGLILGGSGGGGKSEEVIKQTYRSKERINKLFINWRSIIFKRLFVIYKRYYFWNIRIYILF